jgi:hypothetical protein
MLNQHPVLLLKSPSHSSIVLCRKQLLHTTSYSSSSSSSTHCSYTTARAMFVPPIIKGWGWGPQCSY